MTTPTVGLVVVSHSRALARAAVALAQEMLHGKQIKIAIAAGLDDTTFGTDATQIVDAIKQLARTEGIFTETAGGVTIGVLRKLIENGLLDPAAETVAINTGDGLKTLDAVAPTTGMTAVIRPTLDSFREAGLA